ncbi:MAG: metalloregulator ArsR/SmtB family transcription factor [Kiritimatiellia bacterium]|jgi:ArsR family transcriptional regulator|nr:metalloregulator ArsR/SmtB family transcription factor [Kiritimatiellia bacterium]MDP6847176.1 metalloregulator ArsR/SmtB family transcription factor [Kiritimatiellia bacterium]
MNSNRNHNPETLPPDFMASMAESLKVLAHRDRLRIVELLDLLGESPVRVLIENIGLPQATVSHHLNRMKRAGLIRSNRRGREIWYSIADANSLTILNCMRKGRKSFRGDYT